MNLYIFQMLNGLALANRGFDMFVVFVASYLPYLVLFYAIIFILTHEDVLQKSPFRAFENAKKKFNELFFAASAVVASWVTALIFKQIVQAPRPQDALAAVRILIGYRGYDSFPSAHAAVFAALAVAISFYHRRAGIFFGIAALLIGLARIIAGVHFPIDIFAGFLLGGIITYGTFYIVRPWISRELSF